MRNAVLFYFLIFFIGVSLIGGSVLNTYSQFVAEGPLPERTEVVIPKGLSVKQIGSLLKKKGIERYKTTDKTVELNFDEEHTAKIPYIYFLKTAKTIAPMWNYEYKHKKIHITISISEDNKLYGKNSYIYKLIEFMENL